jgi:TolB-like protein
MAGKKIIVCVLLALLSIKAFPQAMTLDEAIKTTASELGQRINANKIPNVSSSNQSIGQTAAEIRQQLTAQTKIAVLNFSSDSQKLSAYVIDELNNAIVRDGSLSVVDRQQLNLVRQELDFQMTTDVDDQSAQSAGKFLGAQSVLSGSFTVIGKTYRFRVRVIAVETGVVQYSNSIDIKKDNVLSSLTSTNPHGQPIKLPDSFREETRLWSVGLNVGSSFATPLFIGNVGITIPPFPYTFIELGVDIGLVHGKAGDLEIKDVKYHSWYYYGRFNAFVPFEQNGGWYIGLGGGFMDAYYKFPSAEASMQTPAFDVASGFFFGNEHHLFRIGYALRTNFSGINHRVMIGYTHRICDF